MVETIEPLGPQHDRGAFSCGVAIIDDYLISHNLEVAVAGHRVYVAIGPNNEILGFYSLQPIIWQVRGPRKQSISTIDLELTMVGVKTEYQGQGLVGPRLLLDAFEKVMEVNRLVGGIRRLQVGPLNDRCRKFYSKAGFGDMEAAKRMFITVREIVDAMSAG